MAIGAMQREAGLAYEVRGESTENTAQGGTPSKSYEPNGSLVEAIG
jgi:hypothetical protein